MSDVNRLRTALSLALTIPDDRALGVALALADSAAYAPSGDGRGPGEHHDPEATRLRGLVDLAQQGDAEAFGQLYDHYVTGIFRFIYYRVGSQQLAEDLTSETFVRGLRAIQRFSWQGKDFGAWLTTIARNLVADHFKSSRSRLEVVTETVPEGRTHVDGPEHEVLEHLSREILLTAVRALPNEQRDCILMRFIQGLSIAQTAAALGRTEGAVKQLQLRAVRALARSLPGDAR